MGRSLKKKIVCFLTSSAITLSVGASGTSAFGTDIFMYGSAVVLFTGSAALTAALGTPKAKSGVNACESSFNSNLGTHKVESGVNTCKFSFDPNLDIDLESLPFHGCDTYGYSEGEEKYCYCTYGSKELKYCNFSENVAFWHNIDVMCRYGYKRLLCDKLFACALITLLEKECKFFYSNVRNIMDIVKYTGWVFDRCGLSKFEKEIEDNKLIDKFVYEFALKGSESGNWRERAGGVAKFVYDLNNKGGEFDKFCRDCLEGRA